MKKPSTKKRSSRLPVRIISVSILCLAGIFFLLIFSVRYLTTSDYFKIKDSDYFAGQNIFKVIFRNKLQKEAKRLLHLYPDYKRIILRSLLPDKITADFMPHEAVALLRLSDDFYVNEEGVLFHLVPQQEHNLDLPLIIGLERRIPRPRSGVKYVEDSLLATLEFIEILDKNLGEYIKIKEINLVNINDVFLYTTTDCKINLGGIKSFNKDLSILQRLISGIKSDLIKIEYIDLRFGEPVVKYK